MFASTVACRHPIFPLPLFTLVRILFGMRSDGKQIFWMAGRLYALVVSDGPIGRDGERFAAQFDHEAGVLRVSRLVPVRHRPWVVAVAVSDAYARLCRPVDRVSPASASAHPDEPAVVWHRPAGVARRRGLEGGRRPT